MSVLWVPQGTIPVISGQAYKVTTAVFLVTGTGTVTILVSIQYRPFTFVLPYYGQKEKSLII